MAGTLDNSKIIQVYLTDANGNPGSIPAPVGGALESTQTAGNVSLASIDTKTSTTNTLLTTQNTYLDGVEGSLTTIATNSGDTSTINVAPDSSVMKIGNTSVTPKFAVISASSSGDNTIVAAVASKKIRVLAYNLMGAGAVNARFQTAAAGAYLTGLKYIAAAGGGICAPFNPVGWFETVAGDLLNLELSGAVAVGGEIVYIEV